MGVSSMVQVANLALTHLGEGAIESLTQNNDRAIALNEVFEATKRAELRRNTWGFAVRRASLAKLTAQTAWGGKNQFPVPDGFIRLVFDDETEQRKDWMVESNSDDTKVIVTTDGAPLNIKYIHDISAPGLFDDLFVQSFAAKLAMDTCYRITGSNAKYDRAKDAYDDALAEARRVKAIEQASPEPPEDTWLEVRR